MPKWMLCATPGGFLSVVSEVTPSSNTQFTTEMKVRSREEGKALPKVETMNLCALKNDSKLWNTYWHEWMDLLINFCFLCLFFDSFPSVVCFILF